MKQAAICPRMHVRGEVRPSEFPCFKEFLTADAADAADGKEEGGSKRRIYILHPCPPRNPRLDFSAARPLLVFKKTKKKTLLF